MAVTSVGLISSVLIARLYGVDVLGQYTLAAAPSVALLYLSSAREQVALVRELAVLAPRAPRVTALFLAVFTFSSGLTLVVAVPVVVVTYVVFTGPLAQPDLVLPAITGVVGYLLITNPCWNLDMVFTAFRAGRELFYVRLLHASAFFALAVLAAAADATVWDLVIAWNLAWALGLLLRLALIRPLMVSRISRDEVRAGFRTLPSLVRFGLKLAPGTIADGVSVESATWIIAATNPVAAVGAYSRAWLLGGRLLEINHRIAEVLFPTLVERRAAGDTEGFARVLIDSLRYSCVALALPAAAGGGSAVGVMELFGPGFAAAAEALALILWIPLLVTLTNLQGHALLAFDRPLLNTAFSLVRMVITVALGIVLAASTGITGMAIALVTGYAVDLALTWHAAQRVTRTPARRFWPYRDVLALVGACSVTFAVARWLDSSFASPAGTVLALTAASLVYAALVLLTVVHDRDRERLGVLTARVRQRRRPADAAADAE